MGDAEVERAADDRAADGQRPVVAEVLPQPERDRGQLQAAAPAAPVGDLLVAVGGGRVERHRPALDRVGHRSRVFHGPTELDPGVVPSASAVRRTRFGARFGHWDSDRRGRRRLRFGAHVVSTRLTIHGARLRRRGADRKEQRHSMARIRQQNVLAAQWSPNGGTIGAPDLTSPDNQVFGANVFSPAIQRQRLPKDVYKRLSKTLAKGEALDTSLADAVALAMKEWALEKGATHYTPRVPAADRADRREARQLLRPDRRGHGAGRVLRQGADPGRARRLVVPHRRHPRDVRGPRLHRLGSDQPGVHPGEPQRRAALHPDRVRVLDGRGAGPQDPAAALDGRAVEVGDAGAEAVRQHAAPRGCSPPSAPSRSTS